MKKLYILYLLLVVTAFLLVGCKPKTEEVTTTTKFPRNTTAEAVDNDDTQETTTPRIAESPTASRK